MLLSHWRKALLQAYLLIFLKKTARLLFVMKFRHPMNYVLNYVESRPNLRKYSNIQTLDEMVCITLPL
jgi:hypothetical protein